MTLIVVDVEAAGTTPVTGTMTEFGAVEFKTRKFFHGQTHLTTPHPDNAAIPVISYQVRSLPEVMFEFRDWIASVTWDKRPIFVSDNPAYDWMWIACAFDACGIQNPFGHSARRIGDFYAGLTRNFYTKQEWKKYRNTPHDHNPVNDAMGNVEALHTLMGWVEPWS